MTRSADALAILVAFAVDQLLGEPPPAAHPVVWIGKALSSLGALWPARRPGAAFFYGMMAWLALSAVCVTLAVAVLHAIAYASDRGAAMAARDAPVIRFVLQGVLLGVSLKPLLAWRMLRDEVAAVERALGDGLAENLNDSWVAPLFWPMGTMALTLGVRLSRPGYYALNSSGRSASREGIARGLAIATRAAWGVAAAASLLQLA